MIHDGLRGGAGAAGRLACLQVLSDRGHVGGDVFVVGSSAATDELLEVRGPADPCHHLYLSTSRRPRSDGCDDDDDDDAWDCAGAVCQSAASSSSSSSSSSSGGGADL
jgi:hypothetical protein